MNDKNNYDQKEYISGLYSRDTLKNFNKYSFEDGLHLKIKVLFTFGTK